VNPSLREARVSAATDLGGAARAEARSAEHGRGVGSIGYQRYSRVV